MALDHRERREAIMRSRDETTDPRRSFYTETLQSAQSQLDQLAAEGQQGYEDPKILEYRLLR